jgi:hypothetical protein
MLYEKSIGTQAEWRGQGSRGIEAMFSMWTTSRLLGHIMDHISVISKICEAIQKSTTQITRSSKIIKNVTYHGQEQS